MIVNDKFVEPAYPNPKPAMKKTKDYYNVYGNLWNHPYFSSSKISKFYVNTLAQPLSPISLKQSPRSGISTKNSEAKLKKIKRAENSAETLKKSIKQDSDKFSRYSSYSITPTNALNEWQKIDLIPSSKLKLLIPKKVLENDFQGFQNIKAKNEEIKKLAQWKEMQKVNKNKCVIWIWVRIFRTFTRKIFRIYQSNDLSKKNSRNWYIYRILGIVLGKRTFKRFLSTTTRPN